MFFVPASRIKQEAVVDGQLLINKAIRKAGDIEKLAAHLGYQKKTLIYQRASNMVSRFLIKKLQKYLEEKSK